jgi:serine protease Do
MSRWSLTAATLVLGGSVASFYAGSALQGQPPGAPAVPRELTSYRDVVKKVVPAVVSIEARSKPVARPAQRRNRQAPPDDGQVPQEFRRFFEDMQRQPRGQQDDGDDGEGPNFGAVGFGSGVLVDAKGIVLTNNHVVANADQVEVTLRDGRKFVSRDFKTDPKTDLAIVRLDAKGPLPYLELGDSDAMEVGDRVLAVGAPFGLTGTVTSGIISAKGRNIHVNMYEDFLQTDAAINPGNSGGPLINLEGKVVGINSAIKSRSGGFQGIGLAVASNLARNIMNQLLKDGVVHRGYLGVRIKGVDSPELAQRLGLGDQHGVVVTSVLEDAPAARGGLKDGDVIVSLGGKPVQDERELQTAVVGLPLNKPVDVVVVRDGQKKTLQVRIEEQPRDYGVTETQPARRPAPERRPEAAKMDGSGLEAEDLTAEQAERLGYKDGLKGALVTRVERDSVAGEAGLRRGMVVTKVDRQPVTSAASLRKQLTKEALAKGAVLQVQTPQGTNYVLLQTK